MEISQIHHCHPNSIMTNNNNRRPSTDSSPSSPEFQFWALPQPDLLLPADQLFHHGVLRTSAPPPPPISDPDPDPDPEPEPGPVGGGAPSRRWKDLFKVGEKKPSATPEERKKGRRAGVGAGSAPSAAEINIKLWPFARSRSAGTAGAAGSAARPTARKVSSAPCSRSNSRGDESGGGGASKAATARKWPSSPARAAAGGIHVGRSSPVWQLRRGGGGGGGGNRRSTLSGGGGGGGFNKVMNLNLNVNTCIGYGYQSSCRREGGGGGGAEEVITGAGEGEEHRRSGSGGGTTFSLRTLFTKKVY
ncbi:hypothetical protein QJS04_geneDACA012602 [Acorus gramineus]|uniref:Uncharacterized protein n=1 Tax=Acorus gramineus TaxID=55184 RepID=A0AAV9B1F5_ACOGR|nr:hypothetical protein QJS04_geneDACA012602 [Acorus gramineus]